MASWTWYKSGTATGTAGQLTVAGTLTVWTAGAKAGDGFYYGGVVYEIFSVASNNQLTLVTPLLASFSGAAYSIIPLSPRWDSSGDLALDVRNLIASTAYVLIGTGAPSNGIGGLSAVYYDTTALNLYIKSAGTWGSAISTTGLTWKGAYSAGTSYLPRDLVQSGGSTWVNIAASTGVAPPTYPTTSNAKWDLVSAPGLSNTVGLSAVKGNVIAGNGSVFEAVAVGADGMVPTARASASSGLAWDVPVVGPHGGVLVINGDFYINQRGFAGGALAAGAYGYDRWRADTGGANVSVTTSGVVTLTSGTIVQTLDASFLLPYGAKFNSRQMSASAEDVTGGGLTLTFGTTTFSIPAGTGRTYGVATTGAGQTAATIDLKVASTNGSPVSFSRLKLELGPIATAFQARPISLENIYCQRYYQAFKANHSNQVWFPGFAAAGATARFTILLSSEMRATPTVSVSGALKVMRLNTSVSVDNAGISTTSSSRTGCQMSYTQAASVCTAGEALVIAANADATAQLIFNAEL